MENEQKTKKGLFGMLREAFTKTGGCCCRPGESCDGSGKKIEQKPKEEPAKSKVAQR